MFSGGNLGTGFGGCPFKSSVLLCILFHPRNARFNKLNEKGGAYVCFHPGCWPFTEVFMVVY